MRKMMLPAMTMLLQSFHHQTSPGIKELAVPDPENQVENCHYWAAWAWALVDLRTITMRQRERRLRAPNHRYYLGYGQPKTRHRSLLYLPHRSAYSLLFVMPFCPYCLLLTRFRMVKWTLLLLTNSLPTIDALVARIMIHIPLNRRTLFINQSYKILPSLIILQPT